MRQILRSLPYPALPFLLAATVSCSSYHTVGFLPPVDTTIGNNKNVTALGLGDLNGDGRADVVVVNSQDEVNVLISNGDGTLASGVAYSAEKIGGGNRTMAVGDLNGDGKADVVIGQIDQGTLSIFMNQGDGRLTAQVTPQLNCKPSTILLYDVNGDGKRDVVLACRDPNVVRVYKGNGDGTLSVPYEHSWAIATNPGNIPYPRGLAAGDINGDGATDFVVATDTDLRILNSPKEGQRDYTAFGVSVPYMGRVSSVAIADINGNGQLDITAITDERAAVVYEYAAGGTYAQYASYTNLAQNGRGPLQGIALVQMAGDDKSDLVLALNNQPEIKVVVSRGEKGTVEMPAAASYTFNNNVLQTADNCFAVGDVSGDGSTDVVVRSGNKVSVFLNASN